MSVALPPPSSWVFYMSFSSSYLFVIDLFSVLNHNTLVVVVHTNAVEVVGRAVLLLVHDRLQDACGLSVLKLEDESAWEEI